MTDTTGQTMNNLPERIATEVLGYELKTKSRLTAFGNMNDYKKYHHSDGRTLNFYDWQPHKNLEQACDTLVPWLDKKLDEKMWELYRIDFDFFTGTIRMFNGSHTTMQDAMRFLKFDGQGSTPSEKMADALCKVCLAVKEKENE